MWKVYTPVVNYNLPRQGILEKMMQMIISQNNAYLKLDIFPIWKRRFLNSHFSPYILCSISTLICILSLLIWLVLTNIFDHFPITSCVANNSGQKIEPVKLSSLRETEREEEPTSLGKTMRTWAILSHQFAEVISIMC